MLTLLEMLPGIGQQMEFDIDIRVISVNCF